MTPRPSSIIWPRTTAPAGSDLFVVRENFKQRLLGIRSSACRICRRRGRGSGRSPIGRLPLRGVSARRTRHRLSLAFGRTAEDIGKRLFGIRQGVAVIAARGCRWGRRDGRRGCCRRSRWRRAIGGLRSSFLLLGSRRNRLLRRRLGRALLSGTRGIRRRWHVVLRRCWRRSITRLPRRRRVRLPGRCVGAWRVRNVGVLLRRRTCAAPARRDQRLLRITCTGRIRTLVRIALEHVGEGSLRIDRRARRLGIGLRIPECLQEAGVRACNRADCPVG